LKTAGILSLFLTGDKRVADLTDLMMHLVLLLGLRRLASLRSKKVCQRFSSIYQSPCKLWIKSATPVREQKKTAQQLFAKAGINTNPSF
jgi:hypothetical protein